MFLGIDCSSITAELALITADGAAHIVREDTPRQADVIFDMLKKLLSDAGIEPKNLTAIGAITGPGSFTGIRVGLSLAQGLADGVGIPAYGLDGFAALQRQETRDKRQEDPILVLESKRAELYVQYDGKIEMLTSKEVQELAVKTGQPITHNLGENSCFLPLVSCLSVAAAQHAQLCAAQNIPGEILQPFYVRDADAKPNVA